MQYEYTLRYKGRLKTPMEYENILIKSNTSGQTLRLGEIAKVELGGLQYNVNLLNDGQPAVLGMVQQIAGSNATQIASDVKKSLDELEKSYPPGLKNVILMDVTEFLFASIEEVIFTLIITLVLVFIVVYIFLQDFRSTLIPMIAVPVLWSVRSSSFGSSDSPSTCLRCQPCCWLLRLWSMMPLWWSRRFTPSSTRVTRVPLLHLSMR